MATASSKSLSARISIKHSKILLNKIRRKPLARAKEFFYSLINQRIALDGKYYTSAAKKLLEVLENAEANAKQKNLNLDRLFVKTAKTDIGEAFLRPKSRWRFRGRRAKSSNIEIILEER